jgi:hypothetical protein
MEKEYHCSCTTGCDTYRCSCLKHHEPCDEDCGCVDCQNPLNGVDVDGLTVCAIQSIEKVKGLSDEALAQPYQLACGHETVTLRDLLRKHACETCGAVFWYSFCRRSVVEDSCTWHCEDCRTCRDWREWHCDVCDRCTYGLTMSCEHCGSDSDMMGLF